MEECGAHSPASTGSSAESSAPQQRSVPSDVEAPWSLRGMEYLWKTRLCKYVGDEEKMWRFCLGHGADNGKGCFFAHTAEEQRCVYFARNGHCRLGEQCSKLHTLVLARSFDAQDITPTSFGRPPSENRPNYIRLLPPFILPHQLSSQLAHSAAEAATDQCRAIGKEYADREFSSLVLSDGNRLQRPNNIKRLNFPTPEAVRHVLRVMLELEYAQSVSDIRRYDMPNVKVHKSTANAGFYEIHCEGLAEKRPSVIRGDIVLVRDNHRDEWHQGYVHFVNLTSVEVSFDNGKFQPHQAATCHVVFVFPERQTRALAASLVGAPNDAFLTRARVKDATLLIPVNYAVEGTTRQWKIHWIYFLGKKVVSSFDAVGLNMSDLGLGKKFERLNELWSWLDSSAKGALKVPFTNCSLLAAYIFPTSGTECFVEPVSAAVEEAIAIVLLLYGALQHRLKVGDKVVRNPTDWGERGNEDGGENSVGKVIEVVNRVVVEQCGFSMPQRPQSRTVNRVVVEWPNGHKGTYRWGEQGKFELNKVANAENNEGLPVPKYLRSYDDYIQRYKILNETQRVWVNATAATTKAVTLLHGPPGSGKTTTLVSFVDYVVTATGGGGGEKIQNGSERSVRILVCTPSNYSANLIAERLVDIFDDRYSHLKNDSGGIFGDFARRPEDGLLMRIVAGSYDAKRECSDKLLRIVRPLPVAVQQARGTSSCSNQAAYPRVKEIESTTVVICTLMAATTLYGIGCPPFTHIVIDEAGQATEAEICAVFPLVDPSRTRFILAGDHKQLGPVLRSDVAIRYGFGVSTLERLMTDEEVNASAGTMLIDNYRAHPAIVALYAPTYDNRLVPCADPVKTESLLWNNKSLLHDDWLWPNPMVPYAFYHVAGVERREYDSPSWMNTLELEVVMQILEKVLSSKRITAGEICVLSPYTKQCTKLRQKLHYAYENRVAPFIVEDYNRKAPLPITVCSVEAFQGREAKLVIISCVRSRREEELHSDVMHGIGFLAQPKRINVAISRPMAGLIVVGNAAILGKDRDWRGLIEKMVAQNAAVRYEKTRPNTSTFLTDNEFNKMLSGKPTTSGANVDCLGGLIDDLHVDARRMDPEWQLRE